MKQRTACEVNRMLRPDENNINNCQLSFSNFAHLTGGVKLKRILYHIFSKTTVGFIYLSFFLVQFNFHLRGTPENVSYFSCDYSWINNTHHSSDQHLIHSGSKHSHFKLNKRFHPRDPFTVPLNEDNQVEISYLIQTPPVYEQDPLTNYFFNSPSLRGPPAIV